jgi:hypothetical protein
MTALANKPFGLRDALGFERTAATPTYGTGVDFSCINSFTFDPKVVEAMLEGDDSICASHSNLESVDIKVQNGGMDLTLYDLIFGGTLVDSGSGSGAQTVLDFKVSDRRPYMGIIGQAYDGGGGAGDTLIILPKAKAKGGGGGELAKGKFFTGDFEFTCLPSDVGNDLILRVVNRTTAAALSTTWTSNPVHHS